MFDPVEDGGEAKDAHEGSGGFFVAGGDGAPFLEARPQAFDAVAIVVDPAWAGHGRFVFLGRDRRPGALVPDELAERVRGIALVADDPSRDIRQAIDQILGQGEFMSLTWGQSEADRPAGTIGDHAGLGAIAAARPAKRFTHSAPGSRSPLLGAPAALWCALIEVPSRNAMPSSTPRACAASSSRCHAPSLDQRMKSWAARHPRASAPVRTAGTHPGGSPVGMKAGPPPPRGPSAAGIPRHFAPFACR